MAQEQPAAAAQPPSEQPTVLQKRGAERPLAEVFEGLAADSVGFSAKTHDGVNA